MNEWTSETAEWYASKFGDYATNRLGVDRIEFTPSDVVVDIGCGTGSALRHAAPRVPNGKLIGIDPIARMIEIARGQTAKDKFTNIEFRLAGAVNLQIVDRIADVVLAFDSFDHWSDKAKGLAEVKRIIKPAGQFIMIKDDDVPVEDNYVASVELALQEAGFQTDEAIRVTQDVPFRFWKCSLRRT